MSGVWGEGGNGREGVKESDAARREVVAERNPILRSTATAGARGHAPQGNAGHDCHIVYVCMCAASHVVTSRKRGLAVSA